ncbi:MAG: hypothetical protein AABY08_02345 [Candidatus Thermoplasmatota archaeon]
METKQTSPLVWLGLAIVLGVGLMALFAALVTRGEWSTALRRAPERRAIKSDRESIVERRAWSIERGLWPLSH